MYFHKKMQNGIVLLKQFPNNCYGMFEVYQVCAKLLPWISRWLLEYWWLVAMVSPVVDMVFQFILSWLL